MPIASAGHRWAPASKNELARQLTYDYRTTKKHENTDIHTHARTNTYINATNAGTNELLLITLPHEEWETKKIRRIARTPMT